MTKSYTRDCRYCGRRIQLRQMPGGQWVPFEGFDMPHKCNATVPRGRTGAMDPGSRARRGPPWPSAPDQMASGQPQRAGSTFDGLEFLDVSVPAPPEGRVPSHGVPPPQRSAAGGPGPANRRPPAQTWGGPSQPPRHGDARSTGPKAAEEGLPWGRVAIGIAVLVLLWILLG